MCEGPFSEHKIVDIFYLTHSVKLGRSLLSRLPWKRVAGLQHGGAGSLCQCPRLKR